MQNLLLGMFKSAAGAARPGIAIGDQILDLAALFDTRLLGPEASRAVQLTRRGVLNDLMGTDPALARALRHAVFDLLAEGSSAQARVTPCLVSQASVQMLLPGIVGVLIPGNGFLSLERVRSFEPLFGIAQAHQALVFIHSGTLPNDTSLPPDKSGDISTERRGTLDMQSRLSSIMLTLCLTDYLKPYPDVTAQLHNLGGNTPFEVERLDHISLDRTPQAQTPSSKIRNSRILVDCNSMGAHGIERTVQVCGANRILSGTDGTRFGMQWTSQAIHEARIDEAEEDLIRSGNAHKMLSRLMNRRTNRQTSQQTALAAA